MSAHSALKIIRRAKKPERDCVNFDVARREMSDWLEANETAHRPSPRSARNKKRVG